MKFLRFSYLVDFIAMESLSNVFKYSVAELETKLTCLVDEDYFYKLQAMKGNQNLTNDPLFFVHKLSSPPPPSLTPRPAPPGGSYSNVRDNFP